MHMETPLSIVITTYNRKNILKRCLNSIKSQNYNSYEVIVIDDNSQPNYQEEITKEFPEVIYIYQNQNTGPGPARNKGIAIASNNFVVIMDDDDIFKPRAFQKINEFFLKNHDVSYPVYNFLRSNAKIKYEEYYRVYSFSEMINDAISGDLVHIINKKYFPGKNQYLYPNSKIGAESLLWYEIAINQGFPIINETIVELLEDADERLTNINRQIKYAGSFAEYQINIIQCFKEEILTTNNQGFLIKKYLGGVTYLLLSGEKKRAIQIWRELISYSRKYAVLLPLFILPKKVIIKLFYYYRNK